MPDVSKLLKKAEKMVVQQRLDRAVDLYREVLTHTPNDVSVLNVLGDLLTKLNKSREAATCFAQAGAVFDSQNKIPSALAMYRRANELLPGLEVILKLIDLSTRVKDHNEAARALRALHQHLYPKESLGMEDHFKVQRAVNYAEVVLREDSHHSGVLAAVADLCRLVDKPDLAAQYDLRVAETLIRTDRFEEALRILYPLLRIDKPAFRVIELLVTAHLGDKKPQQGLDLVTNAIANDPQNAGLLKLRARALIDSQRFQEGIEAYHKLLLRDPSSLKDILALVETLVERERLDESAALLDLLTREMTLNHRHELRRLCQAALSRNPRHTPWLERLAGFQKDMNQIPQLTTTFNTLFSLYLDRGDQEEAFRVGTELRNLGFGSESFISRYTDLTNSLGRQPPLKPPAESPKKMRVEPPKDLPQGSSAAPAGAPPEPAVRDVDSVLLDADLLLRYGAKERALNYLQQQQQENPESIAIGEKLKQFFIDRHELRRAAEQCLVISRLHYKAGDLESARALFNEARVYDPTIPMRDMPQAAGEESTTLLRPPTAHDLGNLQAGDTVSHFKILSKLGGGGMGVVYRAEDLRLQRQVAVKVLSPEVMELDRNKERFLHEARSASQINHPNICVIYAVEEVQDTHVIVMEYIEGRSLSELIHAGPLPVNKVINYGIQIADALEEAHSKKIIHRDIKSSNILVTDRHDVVKVLDFGLAKQMDTVRAAEQSGLMAGHKSVTQEGTIVGTVSYMSPEQALGEPLDTRTDLFSLGVVLYEIATGKLPFTGEQYFEILYAIVNTDPKPVHEMEPEIPAALSRIIEKSLEKTPRDRYATARRLCTDLKELQATTARP